MGLESSFTLLREIGIFSLNEQQEIHFSVEAYRGFRYVSIRKYIQEEGFTGPTKEGITLTPEIVRALTPRLLALPEDPAQLKLETIGKFAKRPGICVVAGIIEFGNKRSLELRQWEQGRGYTPKSILLPLDKWADIRKLFAGTLSALNEVPDVDF